MKTFIIIISAIIDFGIISATLPGIRTIMIKSPLYNPALPQWALNRYLFLGLFLATIYFLLALTAGFYNLKKYVKKNNIIIINLLFFVFLFILGLTACARYSHLFNGAIFISKKTLLFALTLSFFLTTIIHYYISLIFNKETL